MTAVAVSLASCQLSRRLEKKGSVSCPFFVPIARRSRKQAMAHATINRISEKPPHPPQRGRNVPAQVEAPPDPAQTTAGGRMGDKGCDDICHGQCIKPLRGGATPCGRDHSSVTGQQAEVWASSAPNTSSHRQAKNAPKGTMCSIRHHGSAILPNQGLLSRWRKHASVPVICRHQSLAARSIMPSSEPRGGMEKKKTAKNRAGHTIHLAFCHRGSLINSAGTEADHEYVGRLGGSAGEQCDL